MNDKGPRPRCQIRQRILLRLFVVNGWTQGGMGTEEPNVAVPPINAVQLVFESIGALDKR